MKENKYSKTFTMSIWRKHLFTFGGLLIVMMTFCTCGNTEYEFSNKPCYFVFDNSTHNDPTLAAAMTQNSGTFVAVTLTFHSGARYFRFSSNQGTSSESKFDGIDSRRSLLLGMNEGLIVGYGLLTDPVTFYAFDRECPNCFSPDELPIRSHPLQINSAGLATCNTCKRKYDMNNGGILAEGEKGNKMVRYRASTTGPYGVLAVN